MAQDKDGNEIIWSITNTEEEGVNIFFGTKMSSLPASDADKLHVLGRTIINLGTRLLAQRDEDLDDQDAEWEDVE